MNPDFLKIVVFDVVNKINHLKSVHVIYRTGNRWCVRRSRALRALKVYDNKAMAITRAKHLVNCGKANIAIVHGKNVRLLFIYKGGQMVKASRSHKAMRNER